MTSPTFTTSDLGCYESGALGHEHCREMLAECVMWTESAEPDREPETPARAALHESLHGPMPDDAWDEAEALEILNDATADGLTWGFSGGDLMLQTMKWEGWFA